MGRPHGCPPWTSMRHNRPDHIMKSAGGNGRVPAASPEEQHPGSCSHRIQQVSAAAELAIDDDLSDVVHVAPLVEELPREGSADEIVEVERWTTERHEGARGKAREPDDRA